MRSFNAIEPINALGSTPERPLPLPFSLEGVAAAATAADFIILTRIFFTGLSFSFSFSFSFSLPDSTSASTSTSSSSGSETISSGSKASAYASTSTSSGFSFSFSGTIILSFSLGFDVPKVN